MNDKDIIINALCSKIEELTEQVEDLKEDNKELSKVNDALRMQLRAKGE